MFGFDYGYVQRKFYGKLLFTDPDSLVYEIEVEDVYKDFYKDRVCLILVISHEIQSFLIMIKSYWQNEK